MTKGIQCKDYSNEVPECIQCDFKEYRKASRRLKCKNYDYTEEFDDWDL